MLDETKPIRHEIADTELEVLKQYHDTLDVSILIEDINMILDEYGKENAL